MTVIELSKELKKYYDGAKRNEASMQVHLFGIDYGHEIKSQKIRIADIVELAGIEKGYIAEVSKGVKLSEVVIRK